MTDKAGPRVDLWGREIPEPQQVPELLKLNLPALGEAEPHHTLSGSFNVMGERKLSAIIPMGAYHYTHNGDHYKMRNGQTLNETRNYGFGLSTPIGENTEAFAVAYRNSYANIKKYKDDVTVMAGVNWDPVKVDMGSLHLKAGLMAGVATTLKGSYADNIPGMSRGGFTAMGGLHAEIVHKASGIGVGATLLPATKHSLGVASFYLKKEF